MIDNRQKAALFIAIVNRVSKQINFDIKLDSREVLYEAFSDRLNFKRLSDELIEYLKGDNDPLLYMQLVRLIETDEIRGHMDMLSDSELKFEVMTLCDAVDKLRNYGDSCVNGSKIEFPNLTPFFANDKAESLFKRAVSAGYLDKQYKPLPGVDSYQLKLIAFAISEILDIPYRQRWVNFDRQWGLTCSLCKYHLPMTKAETFSRITQMYSEVNFTPIFNPRLKYKEPFTTDMTEKQVIHLFNSLRRRCFVALKTKESDFLAMFGYGKVPKPFIKWSGSLYALEYFIRIALADTTRDIWARVVEWIVIDEDTTLNRETLKSGSSYVCRNRAKFDFCDELDKVIAEARSIK